MAALLTKALAISAAPTVTVIIPRPTRPMPRTFPVISSLGGTAEIRSSAVRVVFSWATPVATRPPNPVTAYMSRKADARAAMFSPARLRGVDWIVWALSGTGVRDDVIVDVGTPAAESKDRRRAPVEGQGDVELRVASAEQPGQSTSAARAPLRRQLVPGVRRGCHGGGRDTQARCMRRPGQR